MTDQEEQSLKETKRKEKRAAEEIEQLAREQARRNDPVYDSVGLTTGSMLSILILNTQLAGKSPFPWVGEEMGSCLPYLQLSYPKERLVI